MKESYLQSKIKRVLEQRNCSVYKIKPPPDGIPDLLVSPKHYSVPTFFRIEVKTPTGVLSKVQKTRIKELRRAGEIVFVCDSVNSTLSSLKRFMAWYDAKIKS